MPVLTALYPATPGARFDRDYYRTGHLPLVREQLGDALAGIEALEPAGTDEAGFVMITLLRFHSKAEMAAALTPELLGVMMADIEVFTDIKPLIQVNAALE